MNHPATLKGRPERAFPAAAAALMLVFPLILTIGAVSAETWKARIGVLIFMDDSNYHWDDAEMEPNSTALCATLAACNDLGIAINYSMSQYGAFVTGIGGLEAPPDFSWWWYLLLWNGANSSWEEAPKGASDLRLSDGDCICWCPNSSAPPAPNPQTKYPWPNFRADLNNTGATMGAAPRYMHRIWEANLSNGPIDASLAVVNGKVFVSTGGIYDWGTMSYKMPPHLFALDAVNGSVLWSSQTTAAGWQVSSPAVKNGRVFIGTSDGSIMAFREDNGNPLWTFRTGVSATGVTSSPVATSDAVYIPAGDGKMYALSINGNELWNLSMGGPVYMCSPALDAGRLFVGTDNGTFWCIGLDGSQIWNFSAMGKIRASPAVIHDTVYFISTGYDGWTASYSFLYSLNATTGQKLWNVSISPSTSSPAFIGDQIFLTTNTQLQSYTPNGNNIWTYFTIGPVQASPAVSKSILFFAENTENGAINSCEWTKPVTVGSSVSPPPISARFIPDPSQYLMCSPAIADKAVFIGSDNGKVYCLGEDERPWIGVDPIPAMSCFPGNNEYSDFDVKEGETAQLDFSIWNNNDEKLWNVQAQILIDDSPVGEKALLGCLDIEERIKVTFNWTPTAGRHHLDLIVMESGRVIEQMSYHLYVPSNSESMKYQSWLATVSIVLVLVTITIVFRVTRKSRRREGNGNEQK